MNIELKGDKFLISEELVKSIKLRNGNRNPLGEGEVLVLDLLPEPVEVDGKMYPNFNIGEGRTMDLNTLSNFLMEGGMEVANEGDKEHECLKFGVHQERVYDYIKKNGELPNKITVAKRVKEGSVAGFLSGDSGAIRKRGYELLGIDTSKEFFPTVFLQKSADADKKENWKFIERIAVSID